MVKSILNNYYSIIFSIFILVLILYTGAITFNNVKYYNSYINGKVCKIVTEYTDNPDAGSSNYSNFKCTIISEGVYYTSVIKSSSSIKINDTVKCIKKSKISVKILRIGGKVVQKEYSTVDYLSLIFFVFFLSILIYLIYKKIKE